MKFQKTFSSWTTIALLLCVSTGCGPTSRPEAPPAREYRMAEVSTIESSEMRGIVDEETGSVVVVNLWATWCPPCVKELPDIARFYKYSLDRDDVVFLSFSADTLDTLDTKVRPFMKSYEVPFPVRVVGELEREQFIADMGIEWDGLFPTTYLFGADGALVRTWAGIVHYEELVTAVVAAGASPAPETASE